LIAAAGEYYSSSKQWGPGRGLFCTIKFSSWRRGRRLGDSADTFSVVSVVAGVFDFSGPSAPRGLVVETATASPIDRGSFLFR
jgi:hypothetical protein